MHASPLPNLAHLGVLRAHNRGKLPLRRHRYSAIGHQHSQKLGTLLLYYSYIAANGICMLLVGSDKCAPLQCTFVREFLLSSRLARM
jgi:hypothetical protein